MFEYWLWFLSLNTQPCPDFPMKPSVLDFQKTLLFQKSSFIFDLYAPLSGWCSSSRLLPTPGPLPTLLESSEFPEHTWNTWTRVWGRCSAWAEANIQTPSSSGWVVQCTVCNDNNCLKHLFFNYIKIYWFLVKYWVLLV